MLSDVLDSYAAHYAEWGRAGGVKMDARVCALMHTALADAAAQARSLEGMPVPDAARPLPPGVVRLDDFRTASAEAAQGDGGWAA